MRVSRELFRGHHVDVFAVCRLYGACTQLPPSFTGHARNATMGTTVTLRVLPDNVGWVPNILERLYVKFYHLRLNGLT